MIKQIIITLLFPAFVIAQNTGGTTESVKPSLDACPDFSTKKHSSKSDYFKYLSQGDDKKIKQTNSKRSSEEASESASVKRQKEASQRTSTGQPIIEPAVGESRPAPEQKKEIVSPVEQKKEVILPVEPKKESIPVIEAKKDKVEPEIIAKAEGSGNAEADKKEPAKKKERKLNKKIKRLFTKKSNRPAKPNYKKCSTSF